MNSKPVDPAARQRSWPAGLTLAVVFIALTLPVILAGGGGVSEASDQDNYHLPVIRTMADQWPALDLVNYQSATTPGYHIAMALVYRYVSSDLRVLQAINMLMGVALVFVVWRFCARRMSRVPGAPWLAALLVLPVALSTYVLGASIWLTTDNAALLFVCFALALVITSQVSARRIVASCAFAVIAVGIRQIHLWCVGVIIIALASVSSAGRWLPLWIRSEASINGRATLALVPAIIAPFLLLGVFIWLWSGLTPPAFVDQHGHGANPANIALILALLGGLGIFFLPAMVDRLGECLPRTGQDLLVVVIAAIPTLAVQTGFDADTGRWGGAIWEIVRRCPELAGRSLVFPPLAAVGGMVLLRAWKACRDNGHNRQAGMILIAILGFTTAQTMNSQAWQRYCEPLMLICLAWLAALAIGTAGSAGGATRTRNWTVSVAILALIQLALSAWKLYLPVVEHAVGDPSS